MPSKPSPLVADGCEVLIPGGGIPMLLFSALHEHKVDGAPVINGIPIAVKMAEMAVKLRRLAGLGVSRAGEFALAPPEVIEEFMTHPKACERHCQTGYFRLKISGDMTIAKACC